MGAVQSVCTDPAALASFPASLLLGPVGVIDSVKHSATFRLLWRHHSDYSHSMLYSI